MPIKQRNDDNTEYEEGARVPKKGQSLRPDPVHTGDPADEPKQPYGLAEPMDDRGLVTRRQGGVEQPKKR